MKKPKVASTANNKFGLIKFMLKILVLWIKPLTTTARIPKNNSSRLKRLVLKILLDKKIAQKIILLKYQPR